jgi:hypothetical protein
LTQLSLWRMILSKFKRNNRTRQSWNPGSIQSINQLQILVSSRDRRIGECYLGLEEEILEVELSVIHVEPKDTLQGIVRGPR